MEDISRLLYEYLGANPDDAERIADAFGVTPVIVWLWASGAKKPPVVFESEIIRYIQANSQSDRL